MSRFRSPLVVLLPFFALVACGGSGGSASPPPPADDAATPPPSDAGTPADGPPAPQGPPVLVVEPDQGMTPIYALVQSATKTIDMTMYELVDTQMTGLLTQAAKNGVTVRVIFDQNLEMMTNTPAYNALGAAGVQVHWAATGYQATHQKTITVDGVRSAIMSLNLASSDYATSRDFAVITTDAADVAAIEQVFAADFTNAAVTPPVGDDLVWSPTNATSSLVGIIRGAKTSLLVENEEMSDSDIVTALIAAASSGVDVKVVMQNSKSYASEFTSLVGAGVKLHVYGRSNSLYIHAKVIVADYGTSTAQVFVGSENFSRASLGYNRELGLITSDQGILSGVNTVLASDFAGGATYQPPDAGVPVDAATSDGATSDAATSDAAPPPDAGDTADAAGGD